MNLRQKIIEDIQTKVATKERKLKARRRIEELNLMKKLEDDWMNEK